jgi:hypothetical protein
LCSRLVERVLGSGQTTLAVMEEYMRQTAYENAEECLYMAWGFG